MHFKHWGSDSDSAKEQSGICPLGVTEQLEELSGDIPWLYIRLSIRESGLLRFLKVEPPYLCQPLRHRGMIEKPLSLQTILN